MEKELFHNRILIEGKAGFRVVALQRGAAELAYFLRVPIEEVAQEHVIHRRSASGRQMGRGARSKVIQSSYFEISRWWSRNRDEALTRSFSLRWSSQPLPSFQIGPSASGTELADAYSPDTVIASLTFTELRREGSN